MDLNAFLKSVRVVHVNDLEKIQKKDNFNSNDYMGQQN